MYDWDIVSVDSDGLSFKLHFVKPFMVSQEAKPDLVFV